MTFCSLFLPSNFRSTTLCCSVLSAEWWVQKCREKCWKVFHLQRSYSSLISQRPAQIILVQKKKAIQKQHPPEIFKAYDYSKLNWAGCAINSVLANKSIKLPFLQSDPFRLQETKWTDCSVAMALQKKQRDCLNHIFCVMGMYKECSQRPTGEKQHLAVTAKSPQLHTIRQENTAQHK